MAAKQFEDQQHRDSFPLQPSGNQGELTSRLSTTTSKLSTTTRTLSTSTTSYPPQQGSNAPQQARYPPQQANHPSGQESYRPPEAGYFPQHGYSQPPPQQQVSRTQVITRQPGVMENTDDVTFGTSSVRAICPHCRVAVLTNTRSVAGGTACLCFFFFGVFACCCLDEIMDVQHDCPLCKNKIAVYEKC